MTACSGGGLTGPQASQSGSSLKPRGRAETGYVVAERDSLESLTRTTGGTIDLLGGMVDSTTSTLDASASLSTSTSTTLKKKLY